MSEFDMMLLMIVSACLAFAAADYFLRWHK